ncbi:GSCFA domain-containing protein [Compostibacter hankyongensis]|uniref:GSCFA domain-containing protein n=1 Tax=Compostibacter hankyongensis TaxID=1007089 RepID=A0ABP8FPA9_9BACT
MDFRLTFPVAPLLPPLSYRHKLLLSGSCFTEEIGHLLTRYKFDVILNPHGILYNPISILTGLQACLSGRRYTQQDLFRHEGLWHSWDHHGVFSGPDPAQCLEQINRACHEGERRLKEADWLMLTFGSAQVYARREDGRIAGNCHKVPATHFTRRMLSVQEIVSALDNFIHPLFSVNPRVKILFTVSPVRYAREGVVENQVSKSTLLLAVHHLVGKFDRLYYFPAYELVIDDLRDYRFYKDDLVHPNETAIRYVWEKFSEQGMDAESRLLIAEVEKLRLAMQHRPLHAGTEAHVRFLETHSRKAAQLAGQYPGLDFSKEMDYFSAVN